MDEAGVGWIGEGVEVTWPSEVPPPSIAGCPVAATSSPGSVGSAETTLCSAFPLLKS